jgi:hypothetical protein
MFSSIVVVPAVDYSSLEDVLVVLTPPLAADAVSATEPGTGDRGTRNREPGT